MLIDPELVNQDIQLLREVLHESHPGYSVFCPESRLDSMFAAAHVEEACSPRDLYVTAARLIDEIGDGHTNLYFTEDVSDQLLSQKRFFPFTLLFAQGRAYVNHNFSEHEYLPRGSEIVSINGVPMEEIVDELTVFITCDGKPREAELRQLEGQFWWFYALRFGFRNTFSIAYHEAMSDPAIPPKLLLASAIGYNDRFDLLQEVYGFGDEAAEPFEFTIDNDYGVLTIRQFHGISRMRYEAFLNRCFAELNTRQISSLIIDIRENGGGREGFENLLFSHLENDLSNKYRTVEMINVKSHYYAYMDHPIRNRFKDMLYRTFEFKTGEGTYCRKERFGRTLEPTNDVYRGDVYILISGEVFSSGADFASLAKSYGTRCTLIGGETLGGAVANNSGYFYRFILPNTGLVVEVPRVRFELDIDDQPVDHGVIPDVEIEVSQEDLVRGTDPLIGAAHQLIHARAAVARKE